MTKFNRFGNMTPCDYVQKHPYLLAATPFRIIGNTYYVGTLQCSSILIDTGDGFALLDTPWYRDMGLLIYNIYQMGYDLNDLKYIIISHAHIDHYGCAAALAHMTGARIYMGAVDTEDMKNNPAWMQDHRNHGGSSAELFDPDVQVQDGDVLHLGNTQIRCVLTPGHTIGCMSHFWDTAEDGKTYHIGIYGGAGFGSLTASNIERMHLPMSIQEEFVRSIEKVWDEPVDVMLGNHPFHNDTFDKYFSRLEYPGTNPFIDPEEWHRYLLELKEDYQQFLSLSDEEQHEMFRKSGFMDYIGYRMGFPENLTGTI